MIDFFYSDPHFGHDAIISYADRPFADAAEMDLKLIAKYNRVVPSGGVVMWVGDCFFGNAAYAADIMSRLNGHKILVRGNHDLRKSERWLAQVGFDLVIDEAVMCLDGVPVRINHYPYWDREGHDPYLDRRAFRRRGEVLIHGHTHEKMPVSHQMVNVGVDAWDYCPVDYETVAVCVRGAL